MTLLIDSLGLVMGNLKTIKLSENPYLRIQFSPFKSKANFKTYESQSKKISFRAILVSLLWVTEIMTPLERFIYIYLHPFPAIDGKVFSYTRHEPVGVCGSIIPVSFFFIINLSTNQSTVCID